MSYTRTAIATAIVAVSLSAAGPGAQPAAASGGLVGPLPQKSISHRPALQVPDHSPEPAFVTTIQAETPELRNTAEWALSEMAAAGFELPPVTIYMHADLLDCSSDPDRLLLGYHAEVNGRHVIHSCSGRWVLLHELSHVWDAYQLNDEIRHQILEHQGLEEWHSDRWDRSGNEHLASIIAWGLDGTMPLHIGNYDDEHLAEAYRLATGSPPPTVAGDALRQASGTG